MRGWKSMHYVCQTTLSTLLAGLCPWEKRAGDSTGWEEQKAFFVSCFYEFFQQQQQTTAGSSIICGGFKAAEPAKISSKSVAQAVYGAAAWHDTGNISFSASLLQESPVRCAQAQTPSPVFQHHPPPLHTLLFFTAVLQHHCNRFPIFNPSLLKVSSVCFNFLIGH